MSLQPGSNFAAQGFTSGGAGAIDADALPAGIVTRNGADDGAVTVLVTHLATGRYALTGTLPTGYVNGDCVQVVMQATVGGAVGYSVVSDFVIDTLTSNLVSGAAAAVSTNKALVLGTGAVSRVHITTPVPTTTVFGCNLPLSAGDIYSGDEVTWLTGANAGKASHILSWTDGLQHNEAVVTLAAALPHVPTLGDTFSLSPYGKGLVALTTNLGSDGKPLISSSDTQVQAEAVAALTAQGFTTARAGNLDNLDAAVSSRMATFTYTAPANPSDYARNNVEPSWYVSSSGGASVDDIFSHALGGVTFGNHVLNTSSTVWGGDVPVYTSTTQTNHFSLNGTVYVSSVLTYNSSDQVTSKTVTLSNQ